MLTDNDLNKIDKLIVKRVGEAISEKTGPIVSERIEPLVKDLKKLKSDVVHIRKDMKTIVNFFDHECLDLKKHVDRIDKHLNLPGII